MANAKDLTLDAPLKILLYGPAGTKKTTLAATFPNPHFVDFDNGMRTLHGQAVHYVTINGRETIDPDFLAIPTCKAVAKASAFVKGQKYAEHLANTLTKNDTLIIDSLTFWGNYAMDHALALAGRPTPQLQDWGTARKMIEISLEALKSATCNLIIITHEDFEKDEEQGYISFQPKGVTGNQGRILGTYFDEVWRAGITHGQGVDKGKMTYTLTTVPSKRAEGKSRSNLPATIQDPTYEKIKALIK